MPSPRPRWPWIVGGVVVLFAVLGAGLWFYVLKGDADPELDLSSCAGSAVTVDAARLAGTWRVVAGTGDARTTAGYRVKEVFAGGARKVTANGRTNDVTGSLTVAGGAVTKAEFEVDVTTLASDRPQRDNVIRNAGLETDRFPTARFELTDPIALPTVTNCKAFVEPATGKLTLHGVTKEIRLDITARVKGDTVAIQGRAPILMADYDISPPSRPGFVEVDDDGSFEFLISLQQ